MASPGEKYINQSWGGGVSKDDKEDERRRKLNIVKFTGSYFLGVCVLYTGQHRAELPPPC